MEEEAAEGELEFPGLIFRNPDNIPFDENHDEDLLEAKIEAKIGGDKTKSIVWSQDHLKAYVELTDKEGISY